MKNHIKTNITLLAATLIVLAAGCATERNSQSKGPAAIVVLAPTQGNNVKGTVTFTQQKDGVRIVADVEGLTPGEHGFHIHEKGDCSAPDAASAGGHFNPMGKPHAGADSTERHMGDLGNLMADASGHAHIDRVDTILTLEGPNTIIGRGVIVHAKPDDLKTQPTGGAGGRVACGAIQAK